MENTGPGDRSGPDHRVVIYRVAMQGDIVAQGIELMLYGMGTVVLFLAALVLATAGMSGFITRYFPQPEPPPVKARERGSDAPTAAELDPGVVAVITAAIHQHRNN